MPLKTLFRTHLAPLQIIQDGDDMQVFGYGRLASRFATCDQKKRQRESGATALNSLNYAMLNNIDFFASELG
jgi:hypothetical protein